MVTVCTVLPAPDRSRIDAAGDGCFHTLHAESLREALHVARRRRVDAVVISVHRCYGEALPAVARFVREFPAIPAVALVSRHDRESTETLLRLGATGVRTAVDCTEPDGWRRLRDLVGHPASPVAARILARLVPALGEPSEEAWLFFEAVARLAPALSTVRGLARHLRVRPSTLMSRFHRAGIPSPKSYLAGSRATSICSSPRTGRRCARFTPSTRGRGTKARTPQRSSGRGDCVSRRPAGPAARPCADRGVTPRSARYPSAAAPPAGRAAARSR
jgi:hypothetical protein